jgi:hypothetical protein
MAWIESHTVLIRHRKLRDTARALRIKPVYLLGHLHALWHAVLEQQEDGDLSSWSDDLIAELAEYQGDAPQFVSLLQHHGWLDGKLVHDWLDYAGLYLTKKYSTSAREKLVEVWKKHGRQYGSERKANDKRTNGEQHLLAPLPTNQPLPTHPPTNGVGSISDVPETVANARQFIDGHKLLVWSAKLESDVSKLLSATTRDRAEQLVNEGFDQRKASPVCWALGKLANQERAEAAAKAKPKATPKGEWANQPRPYCPG